jgi:hypothetical protein
MNTSTSCDDLSENLLHFLTLVLSKKFGVRPFEVASLMFMRTKLCSDEHLTSILSRALC